MSNVIYVLAGVYIIAMGYFLKTTPGESGPYPAGDERVRRQATPLKRIAVVAFGLLLLMYGVSKLVDARAHPEYRTPAATAARE